MTKQTNTIEAEDEKANLEVAHFLEAHQAEIESEIRDHFTTKYEGWSNISKEEIEEDIKESLEREVKFSEAVIKAYSRWYQEGEPVVLWDVDGTLGKYDLSYQEMPWEFRAGVKHLLPFLKEHFPGIRNGILSNREEVQKQFEDPKLLKSVKDFFDPKIMFSSRDIEYPDVLEQEIFTSLGENPNIDHMQKLTVLKNLKKEGLNVKSIDDNKVAKSMGDAGVCTYEMMPKI